MAFVNLLATIYPVGSVYLSASSISPASVIGGTWQQIEDKYLRCVSTSIGSVGGNDTHLHSLSKNGGALIDTLGAVTSAGNSYLNIGSSSSNRSFSPTYKHVYKINDYISNGSTETDWHSIALEGNTDSASYLPLYQGIAGWIRTA